MSQPTPHINVANGNIAHRSKKGLLLAIVITMILFIVILYSAVSRIYISDKKLTPEPFADSQALSINAESMLRAGQIDAAKATAISALSKSIYNSRAIRTFAQVLSQEAKTDQASALFSLGSEISWRDSETQLALFENAVKNLDIKSGLDNIDSLLRRNVAPDEIFSIYLLGGQDDGIAQAIADKLASNPTWRERFFRYKNWEGVENMDSFERIISYLNQSEAPSTNAEINHYATTLLLKKNNGRALTVWHQDVANVQYHAAILPEGEAINLYWPHSNRSDAPYIIDWDMDNIDDVFIYMDDNDDGRSSIANLDLKKRANGRIASRRIILPQDNIELSVTSDATDDELLSSLSWVATCAGSRQEVIFDPIPRQGAKWSGNGASLNCDMHILELYVNKLGLSKDREITIGYVTLSA